MVEAALAVAAVLLLLLVVAAARHYTGGEFCLRETQQPATHEHEGGHAHGCDR